MSSDLRASFLDRVPTSPAGGGDFFGALAAAAALHALAFLALFLALQPGAARPDDARSFVVRLVHEAPHALQSILGPPPKRSGPLDQGPPAGADGAALRAPKAAITRAVPGRQTPSRASAAGDPYLNALVARIEAAFVQPNGAGSDAGIAHYRIALSRTGALDALRLTASSGTSLLDAAGARAIRAAAPYPPPPATVPFDPVEINIALSMGPG